MDTAKIRKSLTPARGMRAPLGNYEMRREVRREVSERVSLSGFGSSWDGWTLNVSRGGARVIVEREVVLGDELDVVIGAQDASPLTRRGRIVWFQEESDGFIVGIQFVGNPEKAPPPSH